MNTYRATFQARSWATAHRPPGGDVLIDIWRVVDGWPSSTGTSSTDRAFFAQLAGEAGSR
jgi:hypothetical protein